MIGKFYSRRLFPVTLDRMFVINLLLFSRLLARRPTAADALGAITIIKWFIRIRIIYECARVDQMSRVNESDAMSVVIDIAGVSTSVQTVEHLTLYFAYAVRIN